MKTTILTLLGTVTAGWAMVAAMLGALIPFIGFALLTGFAIYFAQEGSEDK